jgi:hypothetical protein
MADYQPPTENLPEFNPAVFRTNNTPLTIAEAERLFVSFPTAQGNVNLSSVNIAGDLTTTKNAHNLGFGYQALSSAVVGSAIDNTAFGFQALKALDVGDSNSAFGDLALPNLTGGAGLRNTGLGHQSGLNLQTGSDNTFVGFNAGRGSGGLRTGSSSNVGLGSDSLKNLTTGQSNTAVGTNSADAITSGMANTFIGGSSGISVLGGSNNTLIGYGTNASASTSTSVAIGYNAVVSADNTIVLGTSSQTVRFNTLRPLIDGGDVSIGTTTSDTLRYYKATPLYTTLPSLTLANIGGISSTINGISYSAAATTIFTQSSLPIGVYSIYLTMLVIVTTPTYLSFKLGGTGFFGPIYFTLHQSTNNYLYIASTVFTNSVVQDLTLVTNSTSVGYSSTASSDLRIVRIA